MQNQQPSKIGSGGVVYCFHGRLLLLKSVTVSILKGVYCLFFSASTMLGSLPSDEVGKPYTQPVGIGSYIAVQLVRNKIAAQLATLQAHSELPLSSRACEIL